MIDSIEHRAVPKDDFWRLVNNDRVHHLPHEKPNCSNHEKQRCCATKPSKKKDSAHGANDPHGQLYVRHINDIHRNTESRI